MVSIASRTRRRFGPLGLVAAVAAWLPIAACTVGGSEWTSPLPFDTALVWMHGEADSVSLLVEVASSDEQRAFGLSRRPTLDDGSGMLFVFDSVQAADHGFWMWRTNIPLDIAFVDSTGVIQRILAMETCGARAESCPSYPPGVRYERALEANLGWFAAQGVRVGDRVTGGH